jgi:hypothetical protein
MFDLLGLIIEGIIDAVGDLFEDGADAASDAASAAVDGQAALPAVALDISVATDISGGIETVSLDSGSSSAGSWLSATDGGIAPDRFDPKPIPGPFSP